MLPVVSGECEFQYGMNIAEYHFIIEIIDPNTGEQKEYGEEGEVVITTLTKEALPIIRYRTRDISVLNPEPCKCGRTSMRMRKISGRTDDMLIIRGVNVFPSQIESVLVQSEALTPNYILVVTKNGYMDELEVQVEVTEEIFTDRFKELKALEKRITDRLQTVLGITAKVRLVAPNSLERFEGKAKRIKDLRNVKK